MSRLFFTSLYFLSSIGIGSAAEPVPRYLSAKPGALTKAKEKLAAGDKDLARALKKLVADADKALVETPPTVMSKEKLPPGGDKARLHESRALFLAEP